MKQLEMLYEGKAKQVFRTDDPENSMKHHRILPLKQPVYQFCQTDKSHHAPCHSRKQNLRSHMTDPFHKGRIQSQRHQYR